MLLIDVLRLNVAAGKLVDTAEQYPYSYTYMAKKKRIG